MRRLSDLAALAAILISRLTLWITESVSFNHYVIVNGFRWHHFYSGIICVLIGFLFFRSRPVIRSVLAGAGVGLIIDEITLPLYLAGIGNFSYWSPGALIGVGLGAVILIADIAVHSKTKS
jgi:hypothetical protein